MADTASATARDAITTVGNPDGSKRDFLKLVTGSVAAIGVASIVWPFIDSMNPAGDVLALSSIDVDLAPVPEGQAITVVWRGKPIFVRSRSADEIKTAETTPLRDMIDPQPDSERVKAGHEKYLVVIGICTHLGCVPLGNKSTDPRGDYGGWFCPCHGSQYRRFRACAAWPGAGKPGRSPLRVCQRYQDQDRLRRTAMAGLHQSEIKNPVINWIDTRMPIFTMMQKEYGTFPTPKNFNYFWNFGALAIINLVIMIATGIFLAMNYDPNKANAFESVQRIMRDVNYGWLLRYVHANGASMFFIVVYIHIFRNLYYGSYKKPRELLFMLGVVILLLMMATAFMGYVLPWGQMSYWGATVITNLFSAIPLVGDYIVTLLWGGFSVDNPTLNRFFSLHYLLPFMITGVVFLHIVALHITGSNNPLGIDVKSPQDTIPFHPYYTIKDSVGICVYLLVFALIVFFYPYYLGDAANFIPANPLATPAHIEPEWYFLPFYAILRSVPNKLGGVILMFSSILVLFVLPWLDTSPVRSARFRPIYRQLMFVFVAVVVLLGVVGGKPPEGIWVVIGRVATAYYFLHFLVLIPLLGKLERPLPLPESISSPVMKRPMGPPGGGGGPLPAHATAKPMEKP